MSNALCSVRGGGERGARGLVQRALRRAWWQGASVEAKRTAGSITCFRPAIRMSGKPACTSALWARKLCQTSTCSLCNPVALRAAPMPCGWRPSVLFTGRMAFLLSTPLPTPLLSTPSPLLSQTRFPHSSQPPSSLLASPFPLLQTPFHLFQSLPPPASQKLNPLSPQAVGRNWQLLSAAIPSKTMKQVKTYFQVCA
eukprot:353761-Chlamydomonas_euryale.AAC.2